MPYFPKKKHTARVYAVDFFDKEIIKQMLNPRKFRKKYGVDYDVAAINIGKTTELFFPKRKDETLENYQEFYYAISDNGILFVPGKGFVLSPSLKNTTIDVHNHPEWSLPYPSEGDLETFFMNKTKVTTIAFPDGRITAIFKNPKLNEIPDKQRLAIFHKIRDDILHTSRILLDRKYDENWVILDPAKIILAELMKFGLVTIDSYKTEIKKTKNGFLVPVETFKKIANEYEEKTHKMKVTPFDIIKLERLGMSLLIVRSFIDGKPSLKYYIIKMPTSQIKLKNTIKETKNGKTITKYIYETPKGKITIVTEMNKQRGKLPEFTTTFESDFRIPLIQRSSLKDVPMLFESFIDVDEPFSAKTFFKEMLLDKETYKEMGKMFLAGITLQLLIDWAYQYLSQFIH